MKHRIKEKQAQDYEMNTLLDYSHKHAEIKPKSAISTEMTDCSVNSRRSSFDERFPEELDIEEQKTECKHSSPRKI